MIRNEIKPDSFKSMAAASLMALVYAVLSIAYFFIFDTKFYLKNILNCGITFVIPLPYIILTGIFVFLYFLLAGQKSVSAAYTALAMAIVLSLVYLLTEMKTGFLADDPFKGNRGLYGSYASAYFTLVLAIFSILSGYLVRRVVKKELAGLIFHIPILICFIWAEGTLFSGGLGIYAAAFLILFFIGISSDKAVGLFRGAKNLLERFVGNERLFLTVIFVAAFLIRYLWGVRLLGITGARFPTASDDGPCYDYFAGILSQGHPLPQESIFAVSGFAYWYFLAAVYKIFGPHNFKAAFTLQSLIGASLPVITYFMARRISRRTLPAALAGILTCVDMNLVFLSVVIGMESLYIPLVYLALVYTLRLIEPGRLNTRGAFLLGCAFGLAYNTRPPELLLFPILLAAIIYIFARRDLAGKALSRIVLSLFLGFLLLISVQYVRNYMIYGTTRIMPGAAIGSFHVGFPQKCLTDENRRLWVLGFSPFENLAGSIATLICNPVPILKLLIVGFIKRLTILYFLPNFGVFDPLYLVNPGSGYILRFPIYVQFYGYLLTAFGIFIALFKRENPAGLALLFTFLAYMSGRAAFFFVLNSRYRGVLMPGLILLFAYGVYEFYKKIKDSYKEMPG